LIVSTANGTSFATEIVHAIALGGGDPGPTNRPGVEFGQVEEERERGGKMAAATQISLETYLTTSYERDFDYVDGVLEERTGGEYDHNELQQAIMIWFYLMKESGASGRSRNRERELPRRVCAFPMYASFPAMCPSSRSLPSRN